LLQNTTNQPRLSPPNSSSGRPTLPSAASWYVSSGIFCYILKM
jgi:hypothetical protein